MLKKILFSFQNKSQLIIAVIGAFLGFTFLITSIHYLIRVNEFGTGAEILGNNSIIIQKKITNFSSMKLAKNNFSEQEIKSLSKVPFIQHVEPIQNNNFNVSLQTDSELVPYFRSDIFVQSVNSNFFKIDTTKWKWKEGDEFVPIILPREFLVMLNTFASASGIPPVSDEIAKNINFKFTLSNDDKKEWVDAKIINFTGEISSILVPHSFMEYGNINFKTNNAEKVIQLIVSIKEGSFGEFEKLMKERSLESKETSMIVGKLKSVAGTLFSILIGISALVIFLAGLVLLQYAQLMMSKNEYELTTLLRIGYSPKLIISTILRYFTNVFAVICGLSIVTFLILKTIIDKLLLKGGLTINNSFTWLSFGAVVFVFLTYTFINYQKVKKEILTKK